MDRITTADKAVELIKDGDCIGVNAFLNIANPTELHAALTRRVARGNGPKGLRVFCSAGFGDWRENSTNEGYIKLGAVDSVTLGHMGSMPSTGAMLLSGELEGYNLPLGVMSHMIRAAASGKEYYITDIGLNLFVDPRNEQYKLNSRSKFDWVELTELNGRETLMYKTPKIDIAFIKGTSADFNGNISFEKECATVDALALAQAVKRRGGKVIVQVERIIEEHQRPRNVIVPGILVDIIALCPQQAQVGSAQDYEPTYSGDVYVPPQEMSEWLDRHERANTNAKHDVARDIIAYRASRELRAGNIVNIGIGIPELVAVDAAKRDFLKNITLTVESGAIGGLPASGFSFGATVGADTIYDMSQQFDFYDGGGLDICFIGALEFDKHGNVNGHYSPKKLTGIGGFANITQSTKKVVFCATFTASGLGVERQNGELKIVREGSVAKFVDAVKSVSFSAMNAQRSGQQILYVTERCVFRLGKSGLELAEVAPGIDINQDILDLLPFDVAVSDDLRPMEI